MEFQFKCVCSLIQKSSRKSCRVNCKCNNVTEYLQVERDYALNICAYFHYSIN